MALECAFLRPGATVYEEQDGHPAGALSAQGEAEVREAGASFRADGIGFELTIAWGTRSLTGGAGRDIRFCSIQYSLGN